MIIWKYSNTWGKRANPFCADLVINQAIPISIKFTNIFPKYQNIGYSAEKQNYMQSHYSTWQK